VALRGEGDSGTRSIGDLDAGIGKPSDLDRSDQQQDKYRQDKSEFYEGLPFVLT
jgi:hypothetical protein